MASTSPEFFTIGSQCTNIHDKQIYQTTGNSSGIVNSISPTSDIRQVVAVPLPRGELSPGETIKLPVWIQGCLTPGIHTRNVKFYYESQQRNTKMR